ncbi:S49 family peptidase [Dyadobacter sp. CY343]|uniref:S49 family peptidase n=1 Tax=Dyadobacter sp. CY343 TaxID=2907299 RepID=UPI001F4876A8|nr:S49 family peptidase [Dyadobacter sp. CY343]MCE7061260.1 S49 family peptidase [Dyadobacter sp. CY343]
MNALTFSGLWLIHEPFASRMEGIILPRLAAGFDPIPPHFKAAHIDAGISARDKDGNWSRARAYLDDYLRIGGGDVAVIPLEGTMSRYGYCGMGNEFLTDVINEAATEPAVKAIVIKGNTPGGTVDSVEMLADAIKKFPKPSVGYVNGMVASAGVFAMSQADQIVMENSISSEIGSIGVLMVHIDQTAALEKAGLKVTIFRASDSVDKARINGVEKLSDDLVDEIQLSLDQAMTTFKGYVKRGRAGKLTSEEIFTGKMYGKAKAQSHGLVDRTGSLADAIKLARKL